jgi:hypothetical protein
MSDRATLEQAVHLLNTHNRGGAPPILAVVDCDVCHKAFAISTKELGNEKKQLRSCPDKECKRQARRWRQTGLSKFKKVFLAILRDEMVPDEHRMALREVLNEVGVELK